MAGQDGHGTVTLRNRSAETIEFQSDGPLVGVVVDPVTSQPTGGSTMAIAGVGLNICLDTGEEFIIPFVFGTASTRIEEGYTLRPGEYLVKVQIPVWDRSLETPAKQRRAIEAPPVRLTVVQNGDGD